MWVSCFIKRSAYFPFLLLLFVNKVIAQPVLVKHTFDPFAINISGGSGHIHNDIIDWSLGEAPIIKTLNNSKLILTTGFLQNFYDPLLLFNEIENFALQIKVGPNPFTEQITIRVHQDGINIRAIRLFNYQGKPIAQYDGVFSGLAFYHNIQIQKLNNPVCYLLVEYTIADKIYKSKIIKLIQN